MKRKVVLTSTLLLAAIAAQMSPAQAKPLDQFRFDEQFDEVIETIAQVRRFTLRFTSQVAASAAYLGATARPATR